MCGIILNSKWLAKLPGIAWNKRLERDNINSSTIYQTNLIVLWRKNRCRVYSKSTKINRCRVYSKSTKSTDAGFIQKVPKSTDAGFIQKVPKLKLYLIRQKWTMNYMFIFFKIVSLAFQTLIVLVKSCLWNKFSF